MSPRKVRVVADLVRGKPVRRGAQHPAVHQARRRPSRCAKLIQSRGRQRHRPAPRARWTSTRSYVKTISVDQGPTLKRFMPRAMGRATRIHKKTSHVHVVLADTPARTRKARS